MIPRVRLQNYASFGDLQEARLEPITVIVGANNSGKSNFLRFVDFMRDRPEGTSGEVFAKFFHRPTLPGKDLKIEWDGDLPPSTDGKSDRVGTYSLSVAGAPERAVTLNETITEAGAQLYVHSGYLGRKEQMRTSGTLLGDRLVGIHAHELQRTHPQLPSVRDIAAITAPVFDARHVHLHVAALREDSPVQPAPVIAANGSHLSALVAHWLLEHPEKNREFDEIISRCLPEMKRVLARCVNAGQVRLYFEQSDGERFDSSEVSDGVLVFAGLVAHALQAPPRTLVLLEEPERGIHPRRLGALVDLLRTLVQERQTQFIMATHSPALLNEFRDEPDAVLTFTRGPNGTIIRRLSDIEGLEETLKRADPGELLANGFFNEAPSISPAPDKQ